MSKRHHRVDDLGIHRETYNAGLAVSFATVFFVRKIEVTCFCHSAHSASVAVCLMVPSISLSVHSAPVLSPRRWVRSLAHDARCGVKRLKSNQNGFRRDLWQALLNPLVALEALSNV